MKINYEKNVAVSLTFPITEVKAALAVLKALHKYTQLDFIQEAITDIEADMQPKKLPMKNYFHLCRKCFRDLDEREDNSFHLTGDKDVWSHRRCPPLNEKRP